MKQTKTKPPTVIPAQLLLILLLSAYFYHLHQNQSHLLGSHRRATPIVQIVLQIAITDSELQLLQKLLVLHQIQSIEHVIVLILGRDQRVVHQIRPRIPLSHIVERISGLDALVHRVLHHRRRQRIEADHVRDLALLLHHKGIDNVRSRREPMRKLFLVEHGRHTELRHVLGHQDARLLQITGTHWSESRDLRLLRQLVQFHVSVSERG